jgi:hypothetical protein
MKRLDAIAKRIKYPGSFFLNPGEMDKQEQVIHGIVKWQNDLLRAAERIIRAYMGDCDCDKTHEEHNRCMGHRWLSSTSPVARCIARARS